MNCQKPPINHLSVFFKVFLFWCLAALPGSLFAVRQVTPFEDIDNKIEKNRDLVEDIYYRLMKEHYFDDASNPEMIYSNNMILSTDLDDNPVEKGTVLLNLIVWLEQKNDAESRLLLRKINRLYFLEFHRAISILDPKSSPDKTLLFSAFHELSRHIIFHPSLGQEYPFRTAITKAVLTLFVINKTVVPITKKRESALYSLEKIKQEMMFINKNLGQNGINEGAIYHFISGLEQFGVIETLVESKFFRNFVIISLIVVAVVFVVWKWDVVGSGLERLGARANNFIDKATDGVTEKLGKGLAKGLIENDQVAGVSQNLNERIDQIRNDVKSLREESAKTTEDVMRAMLRGMVRPETQAPAGAANQPDGNVAPPPPGSENQPGEDVPPPPPGDANPPNANVPQPPPPEGVPAANGVPQEQAINPDLQTLTNVIVGEAIHNFCDRVHASRAGSWFIGPRSERHQQQRSQQQSPPPPHGEQQSSSSWFGGWFGGGARSDSAEDGAGGFGFGEHGDSSDDE